jgi:hypothetical protein
MTWLSNILALSIPDEGYSRNVKVKTVHETINIYAYLFSDIGTVNLLFLDY